MIGYTRERKREGLRHTHIRFGRAQRTRGPGSGRIPLHGRRPPPTIARRPIRHPILHSQRTCTFHRSATRRNRHIQLVSLPAASHRQTRHPHLHGNRDLLHRLHNRHAHGVESGRIRKRVQHILAISLATQSAHPTRHAFNDHRRHQSGRFHIGNGRPAIMEHVLGTAFQPRPARIRHHRHRHAIRGTHCARMRAVVGVDAVAAVASHGHVRAWRRVGETAYGQRARDDARRRCRTARPVRHRLGLPKRLRFAAWYCRPTFGRVRMPDIGGGRTYLQRGIRPAFHATCPLAGAHFIQPVSDPSSRPRLDCAVHSRTGSIAPDGFVCIVPSGGGGVLSCRGTACYQTVKEAGKGEKGSLMYSACAWCFRRNRRFA